MSLYEKFGEFDSVEELNMSAEGLLKEGDTESLIALPRRTELMKRMPRTTSMDVWTCLRHQSRQHSANWR